MNNWYLCVVGDLLLVSQSSPHLLSMCTGSVPLLRRLHAMISEYHFYLSTSTRHEHSSVIITCTNDWRAVEWLKACGSRGTKDETLKQRRVQRRSHILRACDDSHNLQRNICFPQSDGRLLRESDVGWSLASLLLITALGRMGSVTVSLNCAAVRKAWSRSDHHEIPVRESEEAGQLGPGTRLDVSLGYFTQVQLIFCAAFEILLHFITRETFHFSLVW